METQPNSKFQKLLILLIFLSVIAGVSINMQGQLSVDRSKLPDKVEKSRGFQRWLTNLKNKELEFIEGDEFELLEDNEIYNTKWIKISSLDEPGKQEEYDQQIAIHQNLDDGDEDDITPIKKVAYSPNGRMFIDYREIERDGYETNEVQLYGLREDKIIDARIVDCSARANCHFDRGYFISNDLLVVSEFSRNIDKKDETAPLCEREEVCTYTIKIHLIDLINNKRYVYESEPFDAVLNKLIPEL